MGPNKEFRWLECEGQNAQQTETMLGTLLGVKLWITGYPQ
jgi:hypothetical protein